MVERPGELIPGRFDLRIARVFAWLAERMVRRAFASLRIERDSLDEVRALARHDGGVMLLLNHPSWWDPLVVTVLCRHSFADRPVMAPMDAAELKRFRIFTRLGVFGIDPDDRRSAALVLSETARRWREAPRTFFAVTPQGRFTDVREAIEVRPGAALVAVRHPSVAVAALAVEYVFWSGRKPEVLLRLRRIPAPPSPDARDWLDSMTRAMDENGRALAAASIARDEAAFETIVDGVKPRGPYALWLRMTGRGTDIESHRRRVEDAAPRAEPERGGGA